MRRHRKSILLGLVAGIALAGIAVAGSLPRLPADRALPQSGDSPGVVTFSHADHVDATRPDCTVCHPRLFPILKGDSRPVIRHAEMEAGRQCGACHDGEHASGFDDCTVCHRAE
jgi:c(7)-type cytochrome triheme protein